MGAPVTELVKKGFLNLGLDPASKSATVFMTFRGVCWSGSQCGLKRAYDNRDSEGTHCTEEAYLQA